ncbi:MAG: UPF0280 family protein [Pseudomonadota bacterium]|nr:UPF0280 family protein [Pseudomonadota bacterium]
MASTLPQIAMLPDGRRLHLQHGPIDLIIEAFGVQQEVDAAYRQAREHFKMVLSELVKELEQLRRPAQEPRWKPVGPVAARMVDAVWPHKNKYVTPMAAVAGSVADEMVGALVDGRNLRKAYINNSGDIAIYLAPRQTLRLGIVGELSNPNLDGTVLLDYGSSVRGIATSGWDGRSLSLGIADAVTVLSTNAAKADVAATLIANAVNADHPAVARRPASQIDDYTDLGERLVTVSVGELDPITIGLALDAGTSVAQDMARRGLISGAALFLSGEYRVVGGFLQAIAGFGKCP